MSILFAVVKMTLSRPSLAFSATRSAAFPWTAAVAFAASSDVITGVNPVLALALGLFVAGGVNAAKSVVVRPAVTAATGGVANTPVSVAEDVAATGVSMLPGSQLLTLWSRLDGVGDPGEALKGFGKVGDLAGLLMASRKMLGYDLTFGWADFDRPVADLVGLLEQYRSAAAAGAERPEVPAGQP